MDKDTNKFTIVTKEADPASEQDTSPAGSLNIEEGMKTVEEILRTVKDFVGK